jgi:hypothetical protein
MGHLAVECYSRTQINYLDWDNNTQLSTPVLQPQNNIEQLGAQINGLSKEDEEKLIGMLGAGMLRLRTCAVLTYLLTSSEAPQIGLGSPHI